MICYQGALVREVDADAATVLIDPLPTEAALAAIALARENGWHRQVFSHDELFCEQDRPEAHIYARIADVPINFVDDVTTHINDGTTKVVYVNEDRDVIAEALSQARQRVGRQARVTTSLPQLVEIVSATAGKGRAAAAVCQRLGVDIAHTVGVGDAPNDTDMLEAVGYGVAVRPVNDALAPSCGGNVCGAEAGGAADVLEVALFGR